MDEFDFPRAKSDESFSQCFSQTLRNYDENLFEELRNDEPNPIFDNRYEEPNSPKAFEFLDDSQTNGQPSDVGLVNKQEPSFEDSFPCPTGDVIYSPRPLTPSTSRELMKNWQQEPQHVITPLSHLSMNDAGMFDFNINFKKETKLPSKNAAYTYSHDIQKLFANINKRVPINVQCGTLPPVNSRIRVSAMYKKAVDANDIIRQCPNHNKEIGEQIGNTHFIIAEMAPKSYVRYEVDRNGHESVTILCNSMAFTAVIRFMCLSSCKVINRREMVLVFDLEDQNGMLLGRQTVDFVVSTCPGRDRPKAEQQRSDADPQRKRRRVQGSGGGALMNVTNNIVDDGEGEYVLRIKHEQDFLILKHLRDALECQRKNNEN